jgi:hypothetical protein
MLAYRHRLGSPMYLFLASLLTVGVTVGIGFRWFHERYSRIPEHKPTVDAAERRMRNVAISVVLIALLFLVFSMWPFHAALFVPSFVWGATMLLVSGVELRGRPWGFLTWVGLAVAWACGSRGSSRRGCNLARPPEFKVRSPRGDRAGFCFRAAS